MFSQSRVSTDQHVRFRAPAFSPLPKPAPVHRSLNDKFGDRLRTLRRDRNMTQTQLADYLGIDRSYISDVERGKKSISLVFMETFALGFHITLSEMLKDI